MREREEGSEETGVMDVRKRGEEQRRRVEWKRRVEREGEGEEGGDWMIFSSANSRHNAVQL